MSLKGGYKIINLKGNEINSESVTINGLYNAIEENYGKPFLISGIVINGVEKPDVFATMTIDDYANFAFEAYGRTYQVNSDDEIFITKELVTSEWFQKFYDDKLGSNDSKEITKEEYEEWVKNIPAYGKMFRLSGEYLLSGYYMYPLDDMALFNHDAIGFIALTYNDEDIVIKPIGCVGVYEDNNKYYIGTAEF